ncbi:MAG: hypothetical protein M3548_16595, partial [Actinomycetota bacterium]|nr:hypothetical protein [Actinomycetota bacterium]
GVARGKAARARATTGVSDERRAPAKSRQTSAAGATVVAPPKPARPERERAARPGRPRTPAAERAYARRAQRDGVGVVSRPAASTEEATGGRASFVVLIIALLAVGVAATLWLTTQAVADSYRLEQAKKEATRLAEQAAELQREVTKQESAPALAQRAGALGMVPAGDPARIVVRSDGTVEVIGEAKPVPPPPPPPGIHTPAGQTPASAQTPAGQTPAGQASTGQASTGQTPAGQTPAGQNSAGRTPAGVQTPAGQGASAGGQTPVAGQTPAGQARSAGNQQAPAGNDPTSASNQQPPTGNQQTSARSGNSTRPPPGGDG